MVVATNLCPVCLNIVDRSGFLGVLFLLKTCCFLEKNNVFVIFEMMERQRQEVRRRRVTLGCHECNKVHPNQSLCALKESTNLKLVNSPNWSRNDYFFEDFLEWRERWLRRNKPKKIFPWKNKHQFKMIPANRHQLPGKAKKYGISTMWGDGVCLSPTFDPSGSEIYKGGTFACLFILKFFEFFNIPYFGETSVCKCQNICASKLNTQNIKAWKT